MKNMKDKCLMIASIFVLLFLSCVLSIDIQGQCTANAGNDTVVCVWHQHRLGGDPIVVGGSSPYTYSWETSFPYGDTILRASSFLDDTTVPYPVYLNTFSYDSEILLHLTVNDSLGNTCVDSTRIFNAPNLYDAITDYTYGETIFEGDSVWIHDTIYGGTEPLNFYWNPTKGVGDPFSNGTWVSPDTTTFYWLHVIDANGCHVSKLSYEIEVQEPSDASVFATSSSKLAVFPNPTADFFLIHLNCLENSSIVSLYNARGALVYQQKAPGGTEIFTLDVSSFSAGLYVVEVLCGDARYTGQVAVTK